MKLLVSKDNYLIEASYKLTLFEQRIILFALAKLNPQDPQTCFSFHVDDFLVYFNEVGAQNVYFSLRKAIDKLADRWVKTEAPEKQTYFRWISSKTYYKKEGRLEINFTPEIMPYLSHLKKYTQYDLVHVTDFKSTYSIRIYELLAQYKSVGNREITVKELRNILDLGEKYPRFNSLNQRVISPALLEINEKSDLNVDVKPIYVGKEIIALKFTIKFKNLENRVLTEKQIKKFAPLLAADPELGSMARAGQSLESYASEIADRLRTPEGFKKYKEYLKKVGFE